MQAGWFDTDIYTDNISNQELVDKLIKQAKNEDKFIIVQATTNYCPYSRAMNYKVFDKKEVRDILKKEFIFIKVDVNSLSLPLGLDKHYTNITPTFFVLNSSTQLEDTYVGPMSKDGFLGMLEVYSE